MAEILRQLSGHVSVLNRILYYLGFTDPPPNNTLCSCHTTVCPGTTAGLTNELHKFSKSAFAIAHSSHFAKTSPQTIATGP